MSIPTQHLEKITQAIYPQAKLSDVTPLTGGISAQTYRLDITLPDDHIQKVVLRQHSDVHRKLNPNITQDEYRLLSGLMDTGLPISKPIYVDDSHTILDSPYLVIEYIEHDALDNSSITMAQTQQIAQLLCDVHQVDLSTHDFSFLPDQMDILTTQLSQPPTDATRRIHQALTHALQSIQSNDKVLLHGDHWTGNILWRNGNIVGIIDWEDAMIGDPLGDFGKSRLEFLWALGKEKMEAYTEAYLSMMPHLNTSSLPFWDLWGALRLAEFASWPDDPNQVQAMQKHYDWFVDLAIRQLS